MDLISKYSYIWMCNNLMNKKIHFISDCEFFPNFNIEGYIKDINLSKSTSEILFTVAVKNKTLTIGSNMKNLQFEIMNEGI